MFKKMDEATTTAIIAAITAAITATISTALLIKADNHKSGDK